MQASRAQVFTILFNLVKNAIEACRAGGRVSVRATAEDQQVVLAVVDDGAGLDVAAQARLFEPYYTTKATGTGLGLSLVRDAAHACGAALEVASEPGQGTSFRVSLPRVLGPFEREDGGQSRRPQAIAAADAPLDARILVVDDDRALREMLATALSLRGGRRPSVASCAEALALEDSFDIAIIDVLLEGSRGDELLAHWRARRGRAAMLVTARAASASGGGWARPTTGCEKPRDSALVERIRHTLAGAHARRRARGGARA